MLECDGKRVRKREDASPRPTLSCGRERVASLSELGEGGSRVRGTHHHRDVHVQGCGRVMRFDGDAVMV
jgi:hypothetical protein